MEYRWNLDALYLGFDDPAYEADLQTLQNLVDQMKTLASKLTEGEPQENLRQGILLEEKIFVLYNRLNNFPRLCRAANTKDSRPDSVLGKVIGVYSQFASPQAAFRSWLCGLSNLMELVQEDELLRQYTYFFDKLLKESCHQLPGREEEMMARMQQSGGSAWSRLYGLTTSTVKIPWQGKTLSLSAIRTLARDPDPQVRKAALEAELKACESIRDTVAHCLNAVKLETLTECDLRGYDSPLSASLAKCKLSKETLDAMWEAIGEYLPKFWEYLKAKAKLLGHQGGLPWYDLYAPVGDSSRKYSVEDARQYLVEVFTRFDPQVGALMDRAFREQWIDVYPRDGKGDGAFCTSTHAIDQSRILTNFGEDFAGVRTFAHELGHAFHYQCIKTHRPLNKAYGMCLAETASTFNENVLMGAAIENAKTDAEKLALLDTALSGATMSICDIYSRFLFEGRVLENRRERFMDAKVLADFMMDAQKVAYGDGLDERCLHPYMWICKSHYYGATIFYNYPYAFGELLSRGLYARYREEGSGFIPKYKELLHATTVASAEGAAKVAGIDLTDKQFWRGALQTISDAIDQFCMLVKETQYE